MRTSRLYAYFTLYCFSSTGCFDARAGIGAGDQVIKAALPNRMAAFLLSIFGAPRIPSGRGTER